MPERMQLLLWLNASGQPARKRKASLQKIPWPPRWLCVQRGAGAGGCMLVLPQTVCAQPAWCRTNPAGRRCRERLLQNPHCMRCAFPVVTHSVYNAGAIKSGVEREVVKSPSPGVFKSRVGAVPRDVVWWQGWERLDLMILRVFNRNDSMVLSSPYQTAKVQTSSCTNSGVHPSPCSALPPSLHTCPGTWKSAICACVKAVS